MAFRVAMLLIFRLLHTQIAPSQSPLLISQLPNLLTLNYSIMALIFQIFLYTLITSTFRALKTIKMLSRVPNLYH